MSKSYVTALEWSPDCPGLPNADVIHLTQHFLSCQGQPESVSLHDVRIEMSGREGGDASVSELKHNKTLTGK